MLFYYHHLRKKGLSYILHVRESVQATKMVRNLSDISQPEDKKKKKKKFYRLQQHLENYFSLTLGNASIFCSLLTADVTGKVRILLLI